MMARCTCYRCNNTLTMAEALEDWCIVCQTEPQHYPPPETFLDSIFHLSGQKWVEDRRRQHLKSQKVPR